MAATVLGNGLAWKYLGDVDYLKDTPQVHMHFLTSKEEKTREGFEKVELVCHGCGESLLLYFFARSWKGGPHVRARDDFRAAHKGCPNREYEKNCPNYRKSCKTVDLRKPKKKGKEASP